MPATSQTGKSLGGAKSQLLFEVSFISCNSMDVSIRERRSLPKFEPLMILRITCRMALHSDAVRRMPV